MALMPPRHRYLRLVGLLLTAMLGLSGPVWADTTVGGGGATCANPTATIGLTAVNGVAVTCLRSDGAPALSQAIAPTWTALHTFGAGIKLSSDANASFARLTHATELHTLALAATSDTTITTPANSLILGVVLRVTTTITGTTSLDVGVAGATTRYGTGIALTAGTTHRSPGTTSPSIYSAATAIRFSAGVTESFTAGVVRVTITYLDFSAPTSGLTLEQQAERGLPLAA